MEQIEKELSNPLISRIAITYIFLLFGVFSANWVVRIPDLQSVYSLSEKSLGLLLAGLPVGGFIILFFVGRFISIFGSKTMTMVGTLLLHLLYPLVFLMPNIPSVLVILLFIGTGATIMNISMNSQGITVEKDLQSSIISSLHAFFTIGLVIGAVIGSILISWNFGPEQHLLVVSLVFLPISLFSFFFLRKEDKKTGKEVKKSHSIIDTFRD